MLSCRELVNHADALLAGELPWRARLSARLHLSLCRHCRRYLRQLKTLLAALPALRRDADEDTVTRVMTGITAREDVAPRPPSG